MLLKCHRTPYMKIVCYRTIDICGGRYQQVGKLLNALTKIQIDTYIADYFRGRSYTYV